MASGLLDAINSVLHAAGAIPFDWGAVEGAEKSRPTKLFQLVAIWNDQVNREKNAASEEKGGYIFEKPACFLEMIAEENETFLASVSWNNYKWRMHIIGEQLDAGDELGMDQNLTIFIGRDMVKQAFVGFAPPNCSAMFQCDEHQDFDHTQVYHYVLDFKSGFADTKGSYLDEDQTEYIYKDPNTNAELVIGFSDPITEPPADPLKLEIIPT